MTALLLAAAFALIVAGAVLFTNAVEWAGRRLDLGQGAVGSLLAAVGTALPESLIPVVAVLAGSKSEEVAIGAIIGAPFMLGTVAMLLVGAAALGFRGRRSSGAELRVSAAPVRRDLGLFLPCFAAGLLLGVIGSSVLDLLGMVGLLVAYGLYARATVRAGGSAEEEPKPLIFDRSRDDPPTGFQLIAQLVVGLVLIVGGAELFVDEIVVVAESLGISTLVLSLVLAPLATELPEKLNSVIWIRREKDQLAVGNITGAMAFQSTVAVALGLLITDWELDRFAVAAGIAGLAGGALAFWRLPQGRLGVWAVAGWSALFVGFIAYASFAG